jgi:hypothetical protein
MTRTNAAEERVTYAVTSRNNRIGAASGVLCGVRAAVVATQLCGKHMSAAVNQHAAIEEAVFSVDPPRGCIKSLTQLELELRESPELAFGRILIRNELGCAKNTSCVRLV